jgi:hypothetical protein
VYHLTYGDYYSRFDASGKGFMIEEDFVNGWMKEAIERNNDDHLKKVTFILGDNNVLL